MKFKNPLIHGRLVKRYKRFLADVILEDDAEVWLSPVNDPKRRTAVLTFMVRSPAAKLKPGEGGVILDPEISILRFHVDRSDENGW